MDFNPGSIFIPAKIAKHIIDSHFSSDKFINELKFHIYSDPKTVKSNDLLSGITNAGCGYENS